jgi:methionine-rich copper-binding protein CopC
MLIPTSISRRGGAAALSLLFAFAVPSVVAAHATLVGSSPATDSIVEGTPSVITATFDEPLLSDGSGLTLRDAAGTKVASGERTSDDPASLSITEIPELAPGDYEVQWSAATDDGHLERGTWEFTVIAAATPTPAPTPTATPAATPSDAPTVSVAPSESIEPTPSTSTGPTPEGPGTDDGLAVVLPIIIALGVVIGAGGVLLSRRNRGA